MCSFVCLCRSVGVSCVFVRLSLLSYMCFLCVCSSVSVLDLVFGVGYAIPAKRTEERYLIVVYSFLSSH